MFGKNRTHNGVGRVDGGEGRGIPLGGTDDRPPTGYRKTDEEFDEPELYSWDEDEDAADRRRDPLRR